jgi:hypothetical protein
MISDIPCQICAGTCIPFDVIDLNRSGGAESRGEFRPLSGIPIYYYLCQKCGFCFAPEFRNWSLNDFSEKIYNSDYIEVDPNHEVNRPTGNSKLLIKMFGKYIEYIQHLDYGGGNGLLSELLIQAGWHSESYDPFINTNITLEELGSFNLITSFEVFEHVPDVNILMSHFDSLLNEEGMIFFSTLLSDGHIKLNQRLSWWYASPRNGHISLFSKKSLKTLADNYNYQVGSFSPGLHAMFKKIPGWAANVFGQNN